MGRRSPVAKQPSTGSSRIASLALLAVGAAILAGSILSLWPRVNARLDARLRAARIRYDLTTLDDAVCRYIIDSGGVAPAAMADLRGTSSEGTPYLPAAFVPVDPWGRAYRWDSVAPGVPRVFTLGEDGVPGGAGEDADVDTRRIRSGRY